MRNNFNEFNFSYTQLNEDNGFLSKEDDVRNWAAKFESNI